jgi:hypothetical protein
MAPPSKPPTQAGDGLACLSVAGPVLKAGRQCTPIQCKPEIVLIKAQWEPLKEKLRPNGLGRRGLDRGWNERRDARQGARGPPGLHATGFQGGPRVRVAEINIILPALPPIWTVAVCCSIHTADKIRCPKKT